MKIGIQELLVVFIVALVVVGPDKLPYYAKKLGEAFGQFRKYTDEATKDIRESIVEPLNEAQRPLREAMEPVTELQKDIESNVKDIKKSIADIGKPTATSADTGKEPAPDGHAAAASAEGSGETAAEVSDPAAADGSGERSVSETTERPAADAVPNGSEVNQVSVDVPGSSAANQASDTASDSDDKACAVGAKAV